MPQTQRKKGRPSTKLNKLNEIRNSISNQEVKRKADNLIERLAKGNDFNDTKRGLEFLKANEQQYGNADAYVKRKICSLSRKLGEGEIKQVRKTNTLLNILLTSKANAKQKYKNQITNIKEKASKPKEATETAFKGRIQDIILTFNKHAKGFKPLANLMNYVEVIQKALKDNEAITLQINVTLTVGFADKTTETYHIHSDKSNILINSESEIKKHLENHTSDIKDKFETHEYKKKAVGH